MGVDLAQRADVQRSRSHLFEKVAFWSSCAILVVSDLSIFRKTCPLGSALPVFANQCARTNVARVALFWRSPDSLPVSQVLFDANVTFILITT
jgi:hypothetical protein